MKKLFAVFLTLALTLPLAACGEKEADVRGNLETGGTIKDVSGSVSHGEKAPEKIEKSEEPMVPDEPEESAVLEENAMPEDTQGSSVGSMEGGVYTNTFFGIGCTLDSNWTYATAEELAGMNESTIEAVDDEELAESMSNSTAFFDMYASADDGLVGINVVVDNWGVLYGNTLDEDGYADLSMETVEQGLLSMGVENISAEKVTLEFAGAEHVALRITATLEDIPFYEEQVLVKQGNYISIITFCCFFENILSSLEQLFYAV